MWLSDRRTFLKLLAGATPAAALTACGFEPMYGDGAPARHIYGRVDVDLIPTERGYALRERLVELLGPPDIASHRLVVDLNVETDGVALTTENVTTRYEVKGEASYRLVPLDGGPSALTDSVFAISRYSAPETETSSAYAIRAAERDANLRVTRNLAEQMVRRLALNAPDWAT